MKYLLPLSLLLLTACASTSAPTPTPSAITSPTPSLVGRWRASDTQYEFTAVGTILIDGNGMALSGKYEQLAGDRCLSTMSSGSQYRFLCRVDGDKLTLQYDGQPAINATRTP